MGLTLNQIVRRIQTICLDHGQIRHFYRGEVTDFLTDKKTNYPASFLQDTTGTIDSTGKQTTINFRLYLLDLVHVSDETLVNELDVQSDMLQVGEDLLAEFDSSAYMDWKILTAPFTLVREEFDDMVAGVVIDLAIVKIYDKDTCVIPNGI